MFAHTGFLQIVAQSAHSNKQNKCEQVLVHKIACIESKLFFSQVAFDVLVKVVSLTVFQFHN